MSTTSAIKIKNTKVTKAMLQELVAQIGTDLVVQLEPTRRTATSKLYKELTTNLKTPPPETAENIKKLKKALTYLDPDVQRGDGKIDFNNPTAPNWLGCIWAVASLNWASGQDISRQWSMQSTRYAEEGFEAAWNAYEPSHANPFGIELLYKLAEIQATKSPGTLVFKEDQKALEMAHTSEKQPYTFLTSEQLQQLPSTVWRVKGFLPDCGLASIYGPSGSGKSFLVIDLIASIANGEEFYGLKTKPCPAVYVALEGVGGIARRIEAYEQHHKAKLPDTFRVVTNQLSLFNADSITFATAVKDAGLDAGVIVIDTLAQSAPGSDENSSADMGTIISNAQYLQRATDSLVILVHHTGKDSSRGARGHSSLTAALDAAIEVKKTASGRDWLIAKSKDGVDGISHPFKLDVVQLGTDEDGDPLTSCVALGDLFRVNLPKQPQGKNQKAVLSAIKDEYQKSEKVTEQEILKLAEEALPDKGGNSKQRAKEAVKGLVDLGHVVENGGTYELA